jgi:hypothetical protein
LVAPRFAARIGSFVVARAVRMIAVSGKNTDPTMTRMRIVAGGA